MKLFDQAERRGLVYLLPLLLVVLLLVTILDVITLPEIISQPEPEVVHRKFDPNSFEYEQLRDAGVPSVVAAGIVRWRSYGKVYRIKEDLTQVSGMTDSLYAVLKPYIVISDSLVPKPFAERSVSRRSVAYSKETRPNRESSNHLTENFTPEKFLIDTASAAYLTLWGFSPKQAEAVVRFREASGGITSEEQLRRCYVVSEDMANKILPYILFSPERSAARKESELTETATLQNIIVDINTADSATLVAIDGIGAKSAAEIIKYRNLLGGYHSVEQLAELKCITESNFEKFLPKIWCDSFVISKIDINFAGLKELERHPYVSARALRRIIKQRQLKGGWSRIEELIEQNILSEEEAKRLAPYLRFGTRATE